MPRARCAVCGEEHDFASLEPSYRDPDAYLAVPIEEREHRTLGGKDDRRIRTADDTERRYFFRAGMHMSVHGQEQTCCWGIWVEVSGADWNRVCELWNDPDQDREPPFEARLANSLLGYADTLGLPGSLQLTGPTSIPSFRLAAGLEHPLAVEQREGVRHERLLEWLAWHEHS